MPDNGCFPDGNRIQVAAWRTPSRSLSNGECVEAGHGPGVVGVRDSKDPGGPVLRFTPGQWAAFTSRLRRRWAR